MKNKRLFLTAVIVLTSFIGMGQSRSFYNLEADQVWKNPAFPGKLIENTYVLISGSHRFDHLHKDTFQNHSNHQILLQQDDHHSIGINYYHSGRYRRSYENTYAFGVSYAYTFTQRKVMFSLGSYLGFSHIKNKYTDKNLTKFDANLGFSVHNEDFRAGFSIINLSNPNFRQLAYFKDLGLSFQYSHFIPISKTFDVQPVAYIYLQDNNNLASIELNFRYDEWFSFGTFFRTNVRTGLNFSATFLDNVNISYSYEYDFENPFKESIKGIHFIKLHFSLY